MADVPALGIALAGILGAGLALFFGWGAITLMIAATLLGIIALVLLLFVKLRALAMWMVYAAFAVVVGMRGSGDLARDERQQLLNFADDSTIVTIRGIVSWRDDEISTSLATRFWLNDARLEHSDSVLRLNSLQLRLSVPLTEARRIQIGDAVACHARLSSAGDGTSLIELCWSLRERLGAQARLADHESLIVIRGEPSLRRWIFDARQALIGVFEKQLRPDARAVSGALLLGTRDDFSGEFRDELQVTGLAHLFALSGLNTGLLVSLCWIVLAWLRVPQRGRYLVLFVLLGLYATLGLGVPSLTRSTLMASMMILSRLLNRNAHPLNLLLLAAGIELFAWPLHILDAGFHLSYLALGGILTAYLVLKQPLQDLLRTTRYGPLGRTSETLSATIGAQLATAPVVALMFARVPGLAIVANLLAIPLFSILLVLILLLIIADPISAGLAAIIARTIEGLVLVFTTVTGWTAAFPGAGFTVPVSLLVGVCALLMQLAAIVAAVSGRVGLAIMSTLLAINVTVWSERLLPRPEGEVVALGPENSGVAFVRFGNIAGLIGCGPEWASNRTSGALRRQMAACGRESVDFLVLPTRAADKIGGAPSILPVVMPLIAIDISNSRSTQASALLDAALHANGVEVVIPSAGYAWTSFDGQTSLKSYNAVAKSEVPLLVIEAESGMQLEIMGEGGKSLSGSGPQSDPKHLTWPALKGEATRWEFSNGKWQAVPTAAQRARQWWSIPNTSPA